MRYDNLGSFQRHVENTLKDHFLPVYLIISPDRNLSCWVMEWMKKFFKGFALSRSVDDLAPSLFATDTLVMLESEELPPELPKFLESQPKGILLLLSLPKLEASNPLYKKVEKVGVILQLSVLKPWEKETFFTDYLMRRASYEKILLALDAAKAIAARSNGDPFAVDSHYEKLSLWKWDEKKIHLQDVNSLVPQSMEETLFRFTDALFLKKTGSAFEIGEKLVEQGTSPLAILKTFRTQCVLLYQLKNHLNGSIQLDEITSKHPYLKGNILEQKLTQARMHSLAAFQASLLKADELERFYKSSSTSDELFIDLAVSSLV